MTPLVTQGDGLNLGLGTEVPAPSVFISTTSPDCKPFMSSTRIWTWEYQIVTRNQSTQAGPPEPTHGRGILCLFYRDPSQHS